MGLSIPTSYGKKDQPLTIQLIVVDVDGKIVEGIPIILNIKGTGQEKYEVRSCV